MVHLIKLIFFAEKSLYYEFQEGGIVKSDKKKKRENYQVHDALTTKDQRQHGSI